MPEETETTGQLPVVNRLENRKDRLTLLAIGSVIAIVLAVVSICLWQHRQITNLNASISKERVTVASLGSQLTTLDNLNNGVTTVSSQASSIVSLVNGKVAFTMPVGWALASASRFYQQCYNGAFDSKVTCLDSETIVPKALDVDTATSTYGGINISVYQHVDTTSAADWFTNDFSSAGLYEQSGNQIESLTINGYNAYYINTAKATLEYGDQFNDEYYFLVNKSYVVRVASNVNNNAGQNGTTVFNDNAQYSPIVKAFVNSIKM